MHTAPASRARMLALPIALIVLAVIAWLPLLDTLSAGYVDAGFKRSATTFAVARSLNAGISFLQSTTVNVSIPLLGSGGSIAPGELLDPLNDMVEDFSNIMLFITAAFALQKLLLVMGASSLLPLLLSAGAALVAACAWQGWRVPRPLLSALLVLLMARFGLPLAAIGSDLAWSRFMQQDYSNATQALDRGAHQVDSLRSQMSAAKPAAEQERSTFDRIMRGLHEAGEVLSSPLQSAKQLYETLRSQADQWVNHMIHLIVYFLMQALLIPLLLFWAMARTLRMAFAAAKADAR
ncbi:hypothetical protein ACFONG_03860 [Uliginosibacterium paludis]|uniref:Uncharacterized protein n=1 Tax=Uliginosibacterium paludis TaxID=1615952 RepID=A0ABV2CNM6_9RHOO